jgi:hypothetical protein
MSAGHIETANEVGVHESLPHRHHVGHTITGVYHNSSQQTLMNTDKAKESTIFNMDITCAYNVSMAWMEIFSAPYSYVSNIVWIRFLLFSTGFSGGSVNNILCS